MKKGSYHTAWSVPGDSSCTCSYAYGRGPAIGPHTGRRCWPLLAGVWRAIAPLMKPWCAEGEVPTAANLNLYRGWKSCVGWHCDDEPLFWECGDAKLIVSVSLGGSTVFRWRRQSCSDGEGHLCWLGHGDILVMDGQCHDEFLHCTSSGRDLEQSCPDGEGHLCCLGHGDILVMDGRCQDEFLHCTSSGRDLERIKVTFRWIKQHASFCPFLMAGVACCLPTCAQGSSVPTTGNLGRLFWALGFLLCVLCTWGVLVLLASLLCTTLGLLRCASYWTRPLGGGRWRYYLCNFLEAYPKVHKTPYRCICRFSECYK